MKLFKLIIFIRRRLIALAVFAFCLLPATCLSQNTVEDTAVIHADSIVGGKKVKAKRDWATWRPETKKALWLAIVLPGAGQIYNRKFWKLPIIYGGFVGCAYAWSWNSQMYKDYKQAYLDLVDNDPDTKSYEEFLHNGVTIDDSNKSRYTDIFSKRKDRFRRYRDLSIFCTIAVYCISIIDAYVDASLSEFDISNDLSLQLQPTYINTNPDKSFTTHNPLPTTQNGAWGVQCNLKF